MDTFKGELFKIKFFNFSYNKIEADIGPHIQTLMQSCFQTSLVSIVSGIKI